MSHENSPNNCDQDEKASKHWHAGKNLVHPKVQFRCNLHWLSGTSTWTLSWTLSWTFSWKLSSTLNSSWHWGLGWQNRTFHHTYLVYVHKDGESSSLDFLAKMVSSMIHSPYLPKCIEYQYVYSNFRAPDFPLKLHVISQQNLVTHLLYTYIALSNITQLNITAAVVHYICVQCIALQDSVVQASRLVVLVTVTRYLVIMATR